MISKMLGNNLSHVLICIWVKKAGVVTICVHYYNIDNWYNVPITLQCSNPLSDASKH